MDGIKTYIPMQKITDAWVMAKGKMPTRFTKNYPDIKAAQTIIKRIHFLFSQRPILELGKQEIFKREVTRDNGSKKLYTYVVDFNKPDQVKRLRTILTELIDLTADDASGAKKQAISGYLDYVAISSV